MLVANQQRIDLGRVRNGQPHNFKYVLTNNSNQSIKIDNISVGCGSCTQASTDKSVVEPNGQTNINVVFTPTSSGQQLKGITIIQGSNHLNLKFSAEVV